MPSGGHGGWADTSCNWNGALVIEKLADARLLLGRQLGDIGGKVGTDGHALRYGGALGDRLGPALDVLEFLDVLALSLMVDGPRVGDHVGDGVFVAGEPGAVGQTIVEHAIEAVGLVREAVDGVALVALAVTQATEVAALAELGPLVGHLPHHPLGNFILGPHLLWPELSLFFGDVHHHGPRFEHAERRAAALGLVVDHHGHAVVGVLLEEILAELVALLDVDGRDLVFDPTLLEQDRDLFAVRRGPIKNLVHGALPVGAGPQASAIDLASRDRAGMAAITMMRALPQRRPGSAPSEWELRPRRKTFVPTSQP